MLPTGIFISHFYRLLLKRIHIFSLKIPVQILSIIVFSFLMAIPFSCLYFYYPKLLGLVVEDLAWLDIMASVIDFAVVFCLWNVIYFVFHYFQNYKRAEINSLRYLAASKESELNNLKAQLNPHFIFNCMNSIRALIDEDPDKAKQAVTQLSNILRSTLLIEKNKKVTLKEELELVNDYLTLEKIRFEERLNYNLEVEEGTYNCLIPPFIIQSQIENAIKHGISKLPGPGFIKLEVKKDAGRLNITVSNTGRISAQEPLTGVGFRNSIQRLELLYGHEGTITIHEENEQVVVEIRIPLD